MANKKKVLVVDDDRSVLHLIERTFRDSDITVLKTDNAEDGLRQVQEGKPDVILLDIILPETSGLEMLDRIKELDSRLPVVFITADDASDTAIEAMKRGAHDYLLKPLDLAQVEKIVRQAIEQRNLAEVQVTYFDQSSDDGEGDVLVGRSLAMQEVYKSIGRVAGQDITVLIRGESGTGKELVARAVFQHSRRADKPFLAVNCAAIPGELLESELFGHEKGAFTGAAAQRPGKFEQCDGGTIFLDEVGDMPPQIQSKVLRLLQDQCFERVGGNKTIRTDVRVITATNRDLEGMVEAGAYRGDLFHRLNVFRIILPPLRDRLDDVLPLIEHYLKRFNRQMGREVRGIAPDTLSLLLDYSWPGNVRELQNTLKEALLLASGPVLLTDFLPRSIQNGDKPTRKAARTGLEAELERFIQERVEAGSTNLFDEAVKMLERQMVSQMLRLTNGNQSKASKILGVTRVTLRSKIRSLGLSIKYSVDDPMDQAGGPTGVDGEE